jgi:hypothetical protein
MRDGEVVQGSDVGDYQVRNGAELREGWLCLAQAPLQIAIVPLLLVVTWVGVDEGG